MSFPHEDYSRVMTEAVDIVKDRNAKGRNSVISFYAGFPHGSQDVSFELQRRVNRILGNEAVLGKAAVRREDAIDLINYAAFYVMLLDREASGAETKTTPATLPKPHLQSI